MADQISIQHSAAAANIYAIIRDADGAVWNGSTFEAYLTANLGNYDVALTEQGTASRYYTAAMPSVSAGRYSITAFVRAGGSPAETDTCIGDADAEWDGTRFTRLGAPAGVSIADDLLTIDNLVDDLESRLGTPSNLGSGATVAANLVDIEAQTDDIGTAGAGLTAVPWNAAWDAEVQSEATDALNAYDPPTKAELDTAVSTLALQTSVDTLEASAAAIEADTQDIQSRLPAALVGGRIDATVDATGMESGAIDAILDDTIGDGTLTVRQVLRVLVAGMAGKLSGAATTTVTIRNTADSANVLVATVDADGNRSAVTVTP